MMDAHHLDHLASRGELKGVEEVVPTYIGRSHVPEPR
jgi:hypothetical protein